MDWGFWFKYVFLGWAAGVAVAIGIVLTFTVPPGLVNVAIGGGLGLAGMWIGGNIGLRREFR